MMRTVFVIGAGANAEVGMPSGSELKTEIARLLNFTKESPNSPFGDSTIRNALSIHCKNSYDHTAVDMTEKFVDVAINISKAMPLSISIDNFIEARKEDQRIALCGKLAITRAILDAERGCDMLYAYNQSPSPAITEKKLKSLIIHGTRCFFKKLPKGFLLMNWNLD